MLCSLALLAPILRTNDWYVSNQSYRYPYLLAMFREQFLAGHWYPRWLPNLCGGYGYPTFFYYPPAYWYAALPFTLVFSVVNACKLMLVAALTIGGMGAWRLARCFCSATCATIATLSFYLTANLIYAMYFRGDLSEVYAIMLLPWAFYALWQVKERLEQGTLTHSLFALILIASAILYTHPIVTIGLAVMLGLSIPGLLLDVRTPAKLLALLLLAGFASAGLSASYWLPALTMKSLVYYERGLNPAFTLVSESFTSLFDPHSPYLGPVQPLLALLGLATAWRQRFMRCLLAGYLLYVAYMTPLSLPLREAVPALGFLQMPTRVIPVLLALNIMGLALLLGWLERRRTPRLWLLHITLLAALAYSAWPHYALRGEMNFAEFSANRSRSFDDMTHTLEFMPRTADIGGLQLRGAIASARFPIRMTANRASTDISLATSTPVASRVTINQFDFPGWRATLNGEALPTSYDTNGRITLELPAGKSQNIHVWFEDNATDRLALSLLVTLLSVIALVKRAQSKSA